MTRIEVSDFPSPLAASIFVMEDCVGRMRPKYTEAFARLIDSAELLLQFGCLSSLCIWAKHEIARSDVATEAITFFVQTLSRQSLSTGHYVKGWKLFGRAHALSSQADADPFRPVASFLSSLKTDLPETLRTLDDIPELRNRKKGHSFTIPEEKAKAYWNDWYPRICDLIAAARPMLSEFRLCYVSDSDDTGLAELQVLIGNVDLLQAERKVVEAPKPPRRSTIVLTTKAALSRERVLPDDLVCLTPVVLCDEKHVYWYQGRRGNKFLYSSHDAHEHENSGESEFRASLSSLFKYDKDLRSTAPRVPEWATALEGLEYLCDAIIGQREPNPTGFYRGARCSWADIREDLDVPRMVASAYEHQEIAEFVATHAQRWIDQALAYEVPLVTIVGAAGAGKTTALWRMAYELFRHHNAECEVFRQLPGGVVSQETLAAVLANLGNKAVCLVIDDARGCLQAIDNMRRIAASAGFPLLLLMAERTNLWPLHIGEVIELEKLTDAEVDDLLLKLEHNDQLGVLRDVPEEERRMVIKHNLGRELLIALRETTEGRRFDEIILDEYYTLPTGDARLMYEQVCICDCVGHQLPDAVAKSLLKCESARALREKALKDLRDIVRSTKTHYGRGYESRHRLIADVVVTAGIQHAQAIIDVVTELLLHLSLERTDTGEHRYLFLAESLIAWPVLHDMLRRDTDWSNLTREVRQFGRARGKLILAIDATILQRNDASRGFAKALVEEALKGPSPVGSAAVLHVFRALSAVGDVSAAAHLGEQAMEAYRDRVADRAAMCQPYALLLIKQQRSTEALDVVHMAVQDIERGDYSRPLIHAIQSSFEPLCQLGRTEEAIALGRRALQLMPEGEIFSVLTLSDQVAKHLRQQGQLAEALQLATDTIDKCLHEKVEEGHLHGLIHQASEAASSSGAEAMEKFIRCYRPRLMSPGFRQLGHFLRIGAHGRLAGDPSLVRLATECLGEPKGWQIVLGSLEGQSTDDDVGAVVSAEELLKLLPKPDTIPTNSREFMARCWIHSLLRSCPDEDVKSRLDELDGLVHDLDPDDLLRDDGDLDESSTAR